MEKNSQTKQLILVFTTLIKRLVMPEFSIPNPNGGIAQRKIGDCIKELEKHYGGTISKERLVDFCVCQAYAASRYDDFKKTWSVAGGFGKKALERFKANEARHKYYEDKWLHTDGLSRAGLTNMITDRSSHPQAPYIYLPHEDNTKERALNTDVGYFICGSSTLMWSPFSPVCQKCEKTAPCKVRTQSVYPELFRIRKEAYENEGE